MMQGDRTISDRGRGKAAIHREHERAILDQITRLQDSLIAYSTGGQFEGDDSGYQRMRREFLDLPQVKRLLPEFLRRCRTLPQFWTWIKGEKPTYAERRMLLWDSFRPLIDYLEEQDRNPGDASTHHTLAALDSDAVYALWEKALARRTTDPEGAITLARSLLEATCKHVLVPVPVSWTSGRPKHQAAFRLSFSRARAGVMYPCRWRSQPLL